MNWIWYSEVGLGLVTFIFFVPNAATRPSYTNFILPVIGHKCKRHYVSSVRTQRDKQYFIRFLVPVCVSLFVAA